MDHEQFVKEYRGGRGLSGGEILGALAVGFCLWHLFRAIEYGMLFPDPDSPPPPPRLTPGAAP
jgi:hypothetical protein